MKLPEQVTGRSNFEARPGFYDYVPSRKQPSVEWHMNVAYPFLLSSYDSDSKNQAEIQVAEHPALCSLRDRLFSESGLESMIVKDFSPTPVTITGVQRMCAIDDTPDPQENSDIPRFCGNRFFVAAEKEVIAGTHTLKPPSISNILALDVSVVCGKYDREDVLFTINSLYSGFVAARIESMRNTGVERPVIIHSGFTRVHTFNRNFTIVVILQAFAADLAGVDLVFHGISKGGAVEAREAYGLYCSLKNKYENTEQILEALIASRFVRKPGWIERHKFKAADIIKTHRPQLQDRNKATVFKIATSSGYPFRGNIEYARWPARSLPSQILHTSRFDIKSGHFDYIPMRRKLTTEWHLNFADPYLFTAYDSPLMAQDELQVAEHPALGSLRDKLVSMEIQPRTIANDGSPTPITITNVQRRCSIDTSPNAAEGRPYGIYGNAFAKAREEDVIAATRALKPSTMSNILAIAAVPCGVGEYTREEIEQTLNTGYSGFCAAYDESPWRNGKKTSVIIHTGFWGCGAFGGNQTLMTVLQVLAADLAEVDLVFHAGDDHGLQVASEAYRIYCRIRKDHTDTSMFVETILGMNFLWGESDGN